MPPDSEGPEARLLGLVHLLRAISVELDLALGGLRPHLWPARHGRACPDSPAGCGAGRNPATPGWLGTQLGLMSPSTTALIDRLEQAGHVHRERGEPDRRTVRLRVSPEAIELGWAFFGPLLGGMVDAMRPFGEGELDTVERVLRAVAAAVRPRRPRAGTDDRTGTVPGPSPR